MEPKKSFRMRFNFWLDDMKPDQSALISYLLEQKQSRKFSQTIRDGIRLIQDLRTGNLTVLLEQFPWVAEQMKPEQLDREALIEDFKQAMLESGFTSQSLPPTRRSGLTPLNLDDIQIEVTKTEVSAEEACNNFIRNMLALANDTEPIDKSTFTPRRGKGAAKVTPLPDPQPVEVETKPDEPKRGVGQANPHSGKALPPPSFDDLDISL